MVQNDQRGSVMAETVITLPLTFAILFAVFAVAWAATAKTVVMAAARDAVRVYAAQAWVDPQYGTQGQQGAVLQARNRAETALRLAGFRPDWLTVTIRQGVPDAEHVTADLAYAIPLPFGAGAGLLREVNPTWTLTGHAVSRLERQELFR